MTIVFVPTALLFRARVKKMEDSISHLVEGVLLDSIPPRRELQPQGETKWKGKEVIAAESKNYSGSHAGIVGSVWDKARTSG